MFGARGPDFLAVDDVVAVAFPPRRSAQRQSVGPRRRLGDAEGLQAQFPTGDFRKVDLFLLGQTVPQDRAHGVHLRVAGGAVAAGGLDFLQDRASSANRQTAAAEFLRDQGCEIAGFGERADEFSRISSFAIERPPIFAGKLGAQSAHRRADVGKVLMLGAALAHEPFTSARPLSITTASRSTAHARNLTTPASRQNSVRMVSPGNAGAENRPDIVVSRAGS